MEHLWRRQQCLIFHHRNNRSSLVLLNSSCKNITSFEFPNTLRLRANTFSPNKRTKKLNKMKWKGKEGWYKPHNILAHAKIFTRNHKIQFVVRNARSLTEHNENTSRVEKMGVKLGVLYEELNTGGFRG